MKCPYCGTDNPPGEDFCMNCGGALDATASHNAPTVVGSNIAILSPTHPGATTGGSGGGNSSTLTPNAQLENGRYVVEKILGQGGMGAAVLAKDTRVSNKLVVIKELISDSTDPRQRQEDVNNFKREVDTLVQIDHPLVPTVTDSFQERSRYFMVQEYVAGENLENYMERTNKPMSEREALTYASQVLDILDYLSHLVPPLVHRDIKPANIIIGSKDKRAHLVDFGIARADEAKNAKRKQTSALGTPGYAPPEQYQGNADGRSDLYALAATLHHVLSNRDPRNYPPFAYPPVRSLNSQISLDTERVLEHALKINVNDRYQTALGMKGDIDEILADHFKSSGDTSTYVLNPSGPITGTRPTRPSTQNTPIPPVPPTPIHRPQGGQPAASGYGAQHQAQRQVPSPVSQAGIYGRPVAPQKSRGGNFVVFSGILLLVVVVLIGGVLFFATSKGNSANTGGAKTPVPTLVATSVATIPVSSTGIGVKDVNGESIGISDGSYVFDTNRADGDLKKQASTNFLAGDLGSAQSLWHAANSKQTDDAEPLIFLENQRVKSSGSPFITLVVGTTLTGTSDLVQVGRDNLQGAYVAQKEFNANNGALLGGVQVRLLIANSGSNVASVTSVAQQIVQAAQKDTTIVGVMGWPYSGQTVNAINVLGPARIPLVSSTASSNDLSGTSPYFFRIAPPDKSQAAVGARYALQKLNAKNVALFEDPSDSYSRSLADGFNQQFTQGGGTVNVVNYVKGNAGSITAALQQALANNPQPDLIYFAGYSTDVSSILAHLPSSSTLNVLGGDALYNLGGYTTSVGANFSRLRFTAFSYPDEWEVLNEAAKKPAFYANYAAAYNPNNVKETNPYGFTRAAYNVVMAYDATLALLDGSKNGLGGQTTGLTSDKLKQGLASITSANPIQGASGLIAFDATTGDPVNKAVLILKVSIDGHVQMEALGDGKLLAG